MYYSKKFGNQPIQFSFGDETGINTIEVTAKTKIEDFRNIQNLVQFVENTEENVFIYKFATKNTEDTKKLLNHVIILKQTLKILYRFNSNFFLQLKFTSQ